MSRKVCTLSCCACVVAISLFFFKIIHVIYLHITVMVVASLTPAGNR